MNNARSHSQVQHHRVSLGIRRSISLGVVALATAAWLTTPGLHSQAVAAEVDAAGAPAPVGFADIIEKVKPAVVGVRLKIEGAAPSGDLSHEFSAPSGSPSPDSPVPRPEIVQG